MDSLLLLHAPDPPATADTIRQRWNGWDLWCGEDLSRALGHHVETCASMQVSGPPGQLHVGYGNGSCEERLITGASLRTVHTLEVEFSYYASPETILRIHAMV